MSKRTDFISGDLALDEFLTESLSALPPSQEMVHRITPWRRHMNRVLLGFALSGLSFNILGLEYLLPAIGVLLLFLGFRGLRGENLWFQLAWYVSLIRLIFYSLLLILNSSLIPLPGVLKMLIPLGNAVLVIFLALCMWRGIRQVKIRTDYPKSIRSAPALFFYFIVLHALTFFPSFQYPPLILLAIPLYFLIIYNLFLLTKDLNQLGYAIRVIPIRLSDRFLAFSYCSILVLGMAAGYTFSNQHPMSWAPLDMQEQENLEEIITPLVESGFPVHILADLSREDVIACQGAKQVIYKTHRLPYNEGRTVVQEEASETGASIHETVYDVYEQELTQIAVQIGEDPEQWKMIHHFRWSAPPHYFGTEALQILPSFQVTEDWHSTGQVTGRVLYNHGDLVYQAPFYEITEEPVTRYKGLKDVYVTESILAAFSLPQEGQNWRGYLSYEILGRPNQDGNMYIGTWSNYLHQDTRFQYPVQSAIDVIRAGDPFHSKGFTLRQAWMHFHLNDPESTLMPEADRY